eukprot:m.1361338 g.1361338  ORF g.1361338 m.1361338 type:complete len:72 (-) comp24941_c0_seq7:179-394(-)
MSFFSSVTGQGANKKSSTMPLRVIRQHGSNSAGRTSALLRVACWSIQFIQVGPELIVTSIQFLGALSDLTT